MSTSAEQVTGQTQIHERRSHARILPRTLIYVACAQSNGGMVLNVSDDGMAISMAIPVGDEAYSNLHVRMNGLAQSIEVRGRMAWTTKSKKRAGIQLVDVSDEQRGQIREWLAQEGVRDVNLLPRVSEPAASVLPAAAGAAIASKVLNEPCPNLSPVAVSAAIHPAVSAEPPASLLAGLGGTPPEFLGPAQDEPALHAPSFTENTMAETQSSQGSNPNFVGFRENEWDLASVTMVPRKRSKPEGLSALGLLLLWIAIPSFGIGIIVGRRPLQQWLSQGGAMRKNLSHVATPESEIASARDESPDIASSDIDATGSQSIPTRAIEAPADTTTQEVKTSAATKSFVSTPAVAATSPLNSMSTQELRAFKSPSSTKPAENSNATEPKGDSEPKLDAAAAKPATRFKISSASPDAPTSNQNPSAQVATTIAVDSGVDTGTTNYPSVALSNAAAPHPSASSVTPTEVPRSTSSPAASAVPVTGNSTIRQNTAGSTPSIQAAGKASPGSTVNNSSRNNNAVLTASKTQPASPPASTTAPSYTAATKPESRDATARIAPSMRPGMASNVTTTAATKVAPNVYGSSSSRSAAPSGATNLAPVNAQAPLHGVMLVARKNNESFLLRLPVESVASGRSVSVEMQRFVMVPPESRWHHHGPIAKLAVGELLTEGAANQLDTANNSRPGDAVTVRVFVDKNGSVQDLKPVSGRFALMPRVMREVREWQFDQTLIDGKPVESEVNITVEFRSGPQPPSRSREIQAQNSFKP